MTKIQDTKYDVHDDFNEMDASTIGVRSSNGEHVIQLCKQIMEEHSAKKIDGVIVDAWTAAAVWQVYDALNDTNKEKMRNLRTVEKIGRVAQKVAFR